MASDYVLDHMEKERSFESYLQEVHALEYIGTDDDMPDAYERWLVDLDVQEIIDLAELWGKTL